MENTTRKRIMRMLDGLPEEQLYQVLDYIEFLEAKYAREAGRKPDAFQQFAERVEDQLRVRSLAPKAMKGTMRIVSTAGKMLDGVRDLGRDLAGGGEGGSRGGARGEARRGARGSGAGPADRSGREPGGPASGSEEGANGAS